VAAWLPGIGITLSAFKGYALGAPALGRLEIRFFVDRSALLDALRRGEVDVVPSPGLEADLAATLDRFADGTTLQTFYKQAESVEVLRYGSRFADPVLRAAIELAVDRRKLDQILFEGRAIVPRSYLVAPGWAASDAGSLPPVDRERAQALLVGAAVLLGWNPYTLLDAGFQLSFAAVASIFIVTPRVVRALEGYPVSQELAQLIGVSTACGLATAPVTWFQFHQISLVTVPANVVAVPVVVEVLGLALLTAVVAPVAPSVAAAMAQLNGWGAWFVAACARGFGSLPGAQITSPRAAAAVGLGAVFTAAYAWRRGERARAEAGLPSDGDRPAEDRAGAQAPAGADR